MLNSVNSILNRQIPQNKSLSFGINTKQLTEIMTTYNISMTASPLEGGEKWFGSLQKNGTGGIASNGELIGETGSSPSNLLTKIAKSIPDYAELTERQVGKPDRYIAIA